MTFTINYLLAICTLFFLGNKGMAQDCPLPQAQKELHGNNISANILNGGDLFWDRNNAHFYAPNNQFPFVSSIFATGLWVGAMDGFGNVKIAASRYPQNTDKDFAAGPIINQNGQLEFACDDYDRLWEVYGYEIQNHILDFEDDGTINSPIGNIYAYPAQGNPFFENIHGFALPNTPQGLAPFHDKNNDGIYNPEDGDFPLPESVNENIIPAQIIWGIFNDAATPHYESYSDSLGIEVQFTAWAMTCENNELLNNTIFTSHKIINRGFETLDSVFVGLWTDFDLGCFTDDYIGSIPEMNTIYTYNEDAIDGTIDSLCGDVLTYGNNPPVQAITILNQEMSSFIYQSTDGVGTLSPQIPAEFYNFLNGKWRDGTDLTFGGSGYSSSNMTTSYIFPDHPNDSLGWSMATAMLVYDDRRTLANAYTESLPVGESIQLEVAYTFHQSDSLNNFETVNLVYERTPDLQQFYDNGFVNGCTALPVSNEDLTKHNIKIFPNPTSDILNIKIENPTAERITVFDLFGNKVLEKVVTNQNELQLSTANFSAGVYFLQIEMEGKTLVKKFIKM